MIKLPHNGRFRQEVSPLAVSVAHLQSLDCYDDLPSPGQLETTTTDFPKLSCESPGERAREKARDRDRKRERGERKRKGEIGMME